MQNAHASSTQPFAMPVRSGAGISVRFLSWKDRNAMSAADYAAFLVKRNDQLLRKAPTLALDDNFAPIMV